MWHSRFRFGIKVVDLFAPYAKGGNIGLVGGAGVGKTVVVQNVGTQRVGSKATR